MCVCIGINKNRVDYNIMRSLGHEKIETTMIYLEKVFEKERHVIHSWKPEVFGDYISKDNEINSCKIPSHNSSKTVVSELLREGTPLKRHLFNSCVNYITS